MENVNKIIQLADEQKSLVLRWREKLDVHKARLSGFNASLAALNGDESAITMALKRKLEAKINEESDHVTMITREIRESEAKLSAFEEVVKFLPKPGADGNQKELRANSELSKVQDALRKAGKALTLDEILVSIGSADDGKKRISLRGSLRSYAKEGKFFTIEEGDSFGLVAFKDNLAECQDSTKPPC